MKCPACTSEIPSGSRFCPGCGQGLDESLSDPTRQRTPTSHRAAALRPVVTNRRRFEPGRVLASRYRIVERLGEGGMGEVYRADDLALDQPVALKFLPAKLSQNEAALARLRSEVRLARQIAHPNVCRVHDIGEADGLQFISMEFVKGEDLQSLIRRIGHIPKDKAVELAAELSSAVAAAHEKGVLHRDLKPANVMLDDLGHARIMDFGLAAAAGTVGQEDIRSGTPAYMAPEQRSGEEVTERSDLYSLGLVLYELFTGKAAPAENRPPPSSLVEGLDPAVDEVIRRCLEPDPAKRPASALDVRNALPTIDPLAMAVARGETPAPAVVAEAGAFTGWSPAMAWSCLAGVVFSLAGLVFVPSADKLSRVVPLPKSPELLMADARRILGELGYPTPQRDSSYGFSRDTGYIDHLMNEGREIDWRTELSRGEPSVVRFWYRESPELLVPHRTTDFFASDQDPPPSVPGMVGLELDTLGRLHRLSAVPMAGDERSEPGADMNWEPLFSAAGLDLENFSKVAPQELPPSFAEQRAAWTGFYPRAPEIPIRIEASSYRGRLTSLRIVEPWTEPPAHEFVRAADIVSSPLGRLAHVGLHFLFLITLALVAGHNLRLGRGDRKLAFRLAAFLFALVMLQWLFGAHHVPGGAQLEVFFGGLYRAFLTAGLAWLFYIALEPYFRKLWPQSLISWVRLLDGRFRDPRLGRDALVGALWGAGFAVIFHSTKVAPTWLGTIASRPDQPRHPAELIALRGVSESLSELFVVLVNISTHVMYLFVALLLLRFLFRRTWIAVVVHATLYVALYAGAGYSLVAITGWIVVWHFLFFRLGWVPILVGTIVNDLFNGYPLTSDLSAWQAHATFVPVGFCLALALYSFKISLGGRPLLRDLFPDA